MTEPNRDDQLQPQGASSGSDTATKPFPEFIVPPPGQAAPGAPTPGASAPEPEPRRRASSVPSASAPAAPVPPVVAGPTRPPRARGVRLAMFCALVALVGAGATISGPSVRPLLAETLRQNLGDRPWIGIVTGTADTRPPQVVQLDLERFDQRIAALSAALKDTPAGGPVDQATLVRFVEATAENERLIGLTDALRRAEADVLQISKALGALEARLAKLDTRTDLLEANDRALSGRVDAVEGAGREAASKIAALEGNGAKTAGRIDGLATSVTQLGGRVDALDPRLAQAAATADAARTAAADAATRIGAAETGAKGIAERLTAAEAGVKDVVERTAKVVERIGTLEAADTAAAGRVGAVETRLGETLSAVQANGENVKALGGKVEEVVARIPAVAPSSGPILLALATRVRTALDEGEPFAAEIAAVQRFGGNDPAIAAAVEKLSPIAAKGAPSLSLLRREFNTAAKKVLEAEEAAAPAWYDRQIQTIQSMFGWVAPPPSVPGEAARATLSRAAGSITNGHFQEAVKEIVTLPPPGAHQAEAWLRMATVRIEAERAVRALSEGALRRLAANGTSP